MLEVFPPDKSTGDERENKLRFAIQALERAKSMTTGISDIEIFLDGSHRIVVINCNKEQDVIALCKWLTADIAEGTGCTVSAGISNVHMGLDRMARAYDEACNVLNYRMITGNNKVISYCDIKKKPYKVIGKIEKYIKRTSQILSFPSHCLQRVLFES